MSVVTGIVCNPQSEQCDETPEQTYDVINYGVLGDFSRNDCLDNDLAIIEVDRDIAVCF